MGMSQRCMRVSYLYERSCKLRDSAQELFHRARNINNCNPKISSHLLLNSLFSFKSKIHFTSLPFSQSFLTISLRNSQTAFVDVKLRKETLAWQPLHIKAIWQPFKRTITSLANENKKNSASWRLGFPGCLPYVSSLPNDLCSLP